MRALVTGGGGFIGGAIARRLRALGHDVRSFSRGAYPGLEAHGIEHVRGDIADAPSVLRAAEGSGVIFHAAANPGVWGPYRDYHAANVRGTENVIAACRALGIGRLVFTSSPSVTFDGRDQEGVGSEAPYAVRWLAHYPRTKAAAERIVLEANGPGLATVALRPHLVWGPGDNHLIPRLVARARSGRLRIPGSPGKLIDSTYVDNAVEAHVLAAERLEPGAPCAGRAYFISNGEPLPIAELVTRILAAAGLPGAPRRVPAFAAIAAGALLEALWVLLRLRGEPPMTRFVARQLSTAHWFDLAEARRDLGYEPRVSIEEGLGRVRAHLLRT